MLHKCVDAGTVSCPCRLAEYGKCLACSRLAGEDYCSCSWQGVCIYNEYLQNNRCVNQQRSDNIYKIEKKTWYGKDLVVMCISVPAGIAEKAELPGSFVFVKSPGSGCFFDTPVSILRSDYEAGTIELACKITGPKTCALQDAVTIEMRGIYRNGLLGAEKLKGPRPKKVMCLAKGIGLAPIVNYSRWADGRDHIDLIIDLEKISRSFAEDCLRGCKVNSISYSRLPAGIPWSRQEEYDVIVISASDYYQQNIYVPDHKKVLSNNSPMCCGEGICGACIHTGKTGNGYRMCKCAEIKG